MVPGGHLQESIMGSLKICPSPLSPPPVHRLGYASAEQGREQGRLLAYVSSCLQLVAEKLLMAVYGLLS